MSALEGMATMTWAVSALPVFVRRFARVGLITLTLVGAVVVLLSVWLVVKGSTGIEQIVIESNAPKAAAAIVVLTGGLAANRLPTIEGWDRIYTAVQLWADGLAPTIVFSGGGSEGLSEAEVYAEAAVWLGGRRDAMLLDPLPSSTAEHPANLLKVPGITITRDTAL
jgi:uncharacterized SAM-binding protein YcdF (DUF218 family)